MHSRNLFHFLKNRGFLHKGVGRKISRGAEGREGREGATEKRLKNSTIKPLPEGQ